MYSLVQRLFESQTYNMVLKTVYKYKFLSRIPIVWVGQPNY